MKKIKIFAMLAAALLSIAGFMSCTKDEEKADTTALEALLVEAKGLLANATAELYPQDAINTFRTTVNAVDASLKKGGLSQATVTNLMAQLQAAIDTFKASAYGAINPANLTMEVTFDAASSGSFKTTGAHTWDVVPAGGPAEVFGADASAAPTYVAGKVGKAAHFTKGSHFKVTGFDPASLEGKQLSISVWVNPDKVYANNYIISYNYWESWKFQVQDGSKPFLTLFGDNCVDMDNETDNSAPANTWTHLAVSVDLTAKTVDFYVNGQLTKAWTDKVSGTIQHVDNGSLLIGACFTIQTALTFDWFTPSVDGWGCFYGKLDELKVYNIALSAGQVAAIYAAEK